jgi:hypothetical protein
MTDTINFEEDAGSSNKNVLPVVVAARKMIALEKRIVEMADQLKSLTEEHRQIQVDQIPTLMEELGVLELPLDNGYSIKVGDFIEATIPTESAISKEKDPEARVQKQERREACFLWLRQNNSGAVIKKQIGIDLGKTEDDKAIEVRKAITELGFDSEQTEAVHAATLKKLLKEKLAAGVDIPFDTFAIYVGKKASIKPPKK